MRRGTEVERAGYQVKVPDGRHLAVWMYSQGGSLYNKDYTGLAVNNEQGVRALEHLLLLLNGKRVSAGLGGHPDQPLPGGQGRHGAGRQLAGAGAASSRTPSCSST